MLINGPARCFNGTRTFRLENPEFLIHNLIDGVPECGFETQLKFIEMIIPVDKIADWKKCPKCFKKDN